VDKALAKKENMAEINIIIDEITHCLIERVSGTECPTTVGRIHPNERQFTDWNFDWTVPERKGAEVYALFVENDDEVQGLIAFHAEPQNFCYYGDLLESNPKNIGHNGRYIGVGAHLTAFACRTAKEKGYDAYFFVAKSELVAHYAKTLGAMQIGNSQIMQIVGAAFDRLVDAYYKEG
jgi:hypothetical protein